MITKMKESTEKVSIMILLINKKRDSKFKVFKK